MSEIYDLDYVAEDGETVSLSQYRGKVLLIVNTASRCGFTPQYRGLEKLQQDYAERDFSVIGFPCNQFGKQEPGDTEQIRSFCDTKFGIHFPLAQKCVVNGPQTIPLYHHLKQAAPGVLGSQAIKWNFTKFLVGRDGHVVRRFAPATPPEKIAAAIEQVL